MFNIEYLKKRCAAYSTDDLLKHIFVETEEFESEAINIFKDEVLRREGEIKQIITKEAMCSGTIEYILKASFFLSAENIEADGTTYLTSKGLFFIPDKMTKHSGVPYGAGASQAGFIGLIFDEIILSLFTKTSSLNINKELPPSMLSRIIPYSIDILISEIQHIRYSSLGRIQFEKHDDEKEILHFYSDLPMVLLWANSHNIPNSEKSSFWSKLFK